MRLFPTHERRRLEMFFAMLTAGFGAWLLFPSQAMWSPALVHAREMASEAAWGGMFLTNGAAHCVWLAVNGSRWWSPIVRFGAAFGSASLYLIWAASIAAYDPASTGVFTYSALAVGAAFCCVFAWKDAIAAVRIHRAVADHA
jgi:hypothetical protein